MSLRRRALAALGVLLTVYVVFVCTGVGQRLDNRIWSWTGGTFDRGTQPDLVSVVRRVVPVLGGVILLGHSVFRRSWRLLVVGLAVWIVATGIAYLLREVLPRPLLGNNGGKPVNSFPSTHVALAATPFIAVLVLDAVRRELMAVYALVVLGVVLGNTLLMVHRFSDGLGSVALAVAVTTTSCLIAGRKPLHTERR
ncbi:hypothetical protein IEE94_05450 [Yimella sp. cx-573]|nr:hypothetical protein [Yimella sp. cx-573]